jgi:hypothetical protein
MVSVENPGTVRESVAVAEPITPELSAYSVSVAEEVPETTYK